MTSTYSDISEGQDVRWFSEGSAYNHNDSPTDMSGGGGRMWMLKLSNLKLPQAKSQ